ncbi:MAG: tetratricopeptide repeat protein [bacterium]|nr:tetratricopeptide repeat protein [bacterium]
MKRTFIIAIAVLVVVGMAAAQGMELQSAKLYRKQNEWIKALEFFNQALEKDPTMLEAYFERGELYHAVASDSSLSNVAREITGDSEHPQRVLYERMIADFAQAVIEHTPKDAGTIKKLQKKIERMLQERWNYSYFVAVQCDSLYDRAMAAGETDPDPKLLLEKAVDELDLTVKFFPEKWNAYGLRAQILGKLKRYDEATAGWADALKYIEISKLKKEKPEEFEQAVQVIRLNLLQGSYNLNHFRETVGIADQILAADSSDMDALQFKAFAIAQLATDEAIVKEERDSLKSQAIHALRAARASRPDDPTILYYIGQFNLQLADTAAALAAFHEYLTMEERDRDVLFAIGVIYLEGGMFADTVKARDTYAKLVELYPDDAPAWTNYGIALIRLGQMEEGKKAIERGKSLQP